MHGGKFHRKLIRGIDQQSVIILASSYINRGNLTLACLAGTLAAGLTELKSVVTGSIRPMKFYCVDYPICFDASFFYPCVSK
jgi:hypothetical protein